MGQQPHEARPPAFIELAQRPFHLPQRLDTLGLGLGIDQIGKAFDLGEVELAVLEGAARELAGRRRAQIRQPRQRRENARHDRAAAMQMQLDDILAGETCGRRKEKRQAAIERGACFGIAETAQRRHARARHALPRQRLERRAGARPRDAQHGDAGAARSRRQGINRFHVAAIRCLCA